MGGLFVLKVVLDPCCGRWRRGDQWSHGSVVSFPVPVPVPRVQIFKCWLFVLFGCLSGSMNGSKELGWNGVTEMDAMATMQVNGEEKQEAHQSTEASKESKEPRAKSRKNDERERRGRGKDERERDMGRNEEMKI